jgi:acyl-CoA thioester hydrolase
MAFPAVAELALVVKKLGRSSVTYEIALFEKGEPAVRAIGEFTHVFVDRSTSRPAKEGLQAQLRLGLEKIFIERLGKL